MTAIHMYKYVQKTKKLDNAIVPVFTPLHFYKTCREVTVKIKLIYNT